MTNVHWGVILGTLSGICAALGLVAALGRSVLNAVREAAKNAVVIEKLAKDVEEIQGSTDAVSQIPQIQADINQLQGLNAIVDDVHAAQGDISQLQEMAHDHDTRLAVVEATGGKQA